MNYNSRLFLTVINDAIRGEILNIEKILAHYDRYINALCTNTINDSGTEYKYIDDYMKSELKRKLILAILKFNI